MSRYADMSDMADYQPNIGCRYRTYITIVCTLREKMSKYAVEAAWQLSQWEAIEETSAAAKDWNLALANLLKCVHTEDRDGNLDQSII